MFSEILVLEIGNESQFPIWIQFLKMILKILIISSFKNYISSTNIIMASFG